jgi:hypothetical protein
LVAATTAKAEPTTEPRVLCAVVGREPGERTGAVYGEFGPSLAPEVFLDVLPPPAGPDVVFILASSGFGRAMAALLPPAATDEA